MMRVLGLVCACLVLAAATTAQELLTNGGFDGSLNGWTYGARTTFDPTLDATAVSGSGSAKTLAPENSGVDGPHQCVAVTGSTQYKLGGKVFIPSGQSATGFAQIYVNFFTDSLCSAGYSQGGMSPFVNTIGAWTATDTGFMTSPPDARSADVLTAVSNTGGPSFQVNFDDLFFNPGGVQYQQWIAAVIHKDVPSKNARWRSDVAILNRSGETANLTITMHLASGPVSRTAQLGGDSQLLQADVAGWLGVTTDSGPLEVTSDRQFFLSGRTYNQVDATHTYGQDYEGQETAELLRGAQSAWLPHLTESGLYRTNIGITNTGIGTASVTLTLYDTVGHQVWQDSRDYAPGGFFQYQQPYSALGGIASGYATVTVNFGAGVLAYASVIDNNSGDPTPITMKR